MARIFITGSADGLGRAAAQTLLSDGHEVIVHARSAERLAAVDDLIGRGASAVVGDLADLNQTRCGQPGHQLGPLDAVIHNAGILSGPRSCRSMSWPRTCSPPSSIARSGWCTSAAACTGGRADLAGVDWSGQAGPARYSDSKLFVTALAVAARPYPGPMCTATLSTRLGAHQNGRARCSRRPPARAPHPRMAGHK